MKTKIAKLMLIVMTAMVVVTPVSAYESVDFSDKLSELESLMNECHALGIATDYENVNYTTIKRFESYINEDIENGLTNIDYSLSCIDELYTEAKTNLEAYISGEKQAFKINRPNMHNLKASGTLLYDGNTPVYSIGYGFFDNARKDIANFQDFGVNNILMEIGPTDTIGKFYDWEKSEAGNVNAVGERVSTVSHSGKYSLKIKNQSKIAPNVYLRYFRNISCKPNTMYKFGCWSRGTSVSGLWMSANGFNDRNDIYASNSWQENNFYYTSSNNQTNLELTLLCEDVTTVFLDDFFVYELDESGNVVGENLISNSGFEEAYGSAIRELRKSLSEAENNNVAVSLLLSPHYFPTDLSPELYADTGAFIKFNINAPKAREVIEEHIRTVLPLVREYNCIDSICLSNEPIFNTTWFYDFYNPLFREYLKNVHGTIDNLNKAYKSSYSDFSQINMPRNLSKHDALSYDWVEFNDRNFTDWHIWMANIVREYFPDMPLHSKTMDNFWYTEDYDRDYLTRGTDLEMFGEFSDYGGNDTWSFYDEKHSYYRSMFLYDYQQSVLGKPVYNSEDHIIRDGDMNFGKNQTEYALNNMWQGAIHGRNLSTVWLWDRSYDESSNFLGSILFRPDAVAGIGKINLDFARLSDEIAELQQNSEKVAVYFSKPSRMYNSRHFEYLYETYKKLINYGIDCGVVSDRYIDKLSDYDTLVIPNATNCNAETLTAIEEFIKKGGEVYYAGNVLGKDEYNNPVDNSFVIEHGKLYDNIGEALINSGKAKVTLIDENTGKTPTDIDWQYSITDDRLLINMSNMEAYGSSKNISVYYNGRRLTDMSELITDSKGIDTVMLNGYEPQLIEYKKNDIPEYIPAKIENLVVDENSNTISWTGIGTDYEKANIYILNNRNEVEFIETVTGESFAYSETGTYLVTAVRYNGAESESMAVTAKNAAKLAISYLNGGTCRVNVENLSEKYIYGKIMIEYLDLDGKTVGYGYGQAFIRPHGEHEITVAMSLPNGAKSVRAAMYDNMNNIVCSYQTDI